MGKGIGSNPLLLIVVILAVGIFLFSASKPTLTGALTQPTGLSLRTFTVTANPATNCKQACGMQLPTQNVQCLGSYYKKQVNYYVGPSCIQGTNVHKDVSIDEPPAFDPCSINGGPPSYTGTGQPAGTCVALSPQLHIDESFSFLQCRCARVTLI